MNKRIHQKKNVFQSVLAIGSGCDVPMCGYHGERHQWSTSTVCFRSVIFSVWHGDLALHLWANRNPQCPFCWTDFTIRSPVREVHVFKAQEQFEMRSFCSLFFCEAHRFLFSLLFFWLFIILCSKGSFKEIRLCLSVCLFFQFCWTALQTVFCVVQLVR